MKYCLDSMLPLRAFSPRSGVARGFASGGMTLEGDSDGGMDQSVNSEGSGVNWADFNNSGPGDAPQTGGAPAADSGSGGGGGGSDQGGGPPPDPVSVVQQMYEQILQRAPDAAGLANNANLIASGQLTVAQLANAIANSAEAQSNGVSSTQEQAAAQKFTNTGGNGAAATLSSFGVDINSLDPNTFFRNGNEFRVTQADGSVLHADGSGNITGYEAPLSTYGNDPSMISKGYRNMPYANTSLLKQMDANGMVTVNGIKVPLIGKEVVLNNLGKPVVDPSTGDTVAIQAVSPKPTDSGFNSFMMAAMPSLMLGIATGGAGLAGAIGGSILGSASAVGATTLGSAILGSATSAIASAINNGDIGKAALTGAIGGAIGANTGDIANSLVGGGDAIAGESVLKSIAASTGQSLQQIQNLITNTVATVTTAAATGNLNENLVSAIGNTLAGTVVGNYATTITKDMLPDTLNSVAKSVGSVANVATKAAINGKDINTAISNSAGYIIGNAAASNIVSGIKSQINNEQQNQTTNEPVKVSQNNYDQLVAALGTKEAADSWLQGENALNPSGDQYYQTAATNTTGSVTDAGGSGTLVPVSTGVYDGYVIDKNNNFVLDANGNKIPALTDTATTDNSQVSGGGNSSITSSGQEATGPVTQDELDSLIKEGATADEIQKLIDKNGAADGVYFDASKVIDNQQGTQPGQNTANNQPTDIVSAVSKVNSLVSSGVTPQDAINTVSATTGINSGDLSNAVASSSAKSGAATSGDTSATTEAINAGLGTTGAGTTGGATGTTGSGTGTQAGTGTGSGSTGTGTGGGGSGGTGSGGTGTGGAGSGGTKTTGTGTGTTTTGGGGSSTTVPKTTATDYGLVNLVGGTSLGNENYKLIDSPFGDYKMDDINSILGFATGGSTDTTASGNGVKDIAGMFGEYLSGMPKLTAGAMKPRLDYSLTEGTTEHPLVFQYAEGGEVKEHTPEFFSEGGLGSIENRYVTGEGDGTSDSIPAMLANGEFVIPADVVSSLGNGSNDSGAQVLDEFLKTIREHKRKADAKHLPEDSKGPLAYLLEAHKKVGK